MDSHDEMGCQALDCATLCINNCGFFGGAATMNMCSRCYKDAQLKQEQEKLAASSLECVVNRVEPDLKTREVEPKAVVTEPLSVNDSSSSKVSEDAKSVSAPAPAPGPARCAACRKRVGLAGFNCKCGHLFCAGHRFSDKHDCGFDYRAAGRDAIAKANPVVKAEKLDKI